MPSPGIVVSAILVSSCGQTGRQTDKQTFRITESHTDVDDRYTHATPVGVSNYAIVRQIKMIMIIFIAVRSNQVICYDRNYDVSYVLVGLSFTLPHPVTTQLLLGGNSDSSTQIGFVSSLYEIVVLSSSSMIS